MELHERLSTARPVLAASGRDPFAEVKNRIHLAVIGDLGPQLFNANIEPSALRDRVGAEITTRLAGEPGISKDDPTWDEFTEAMKRAREDEDAQEEVSR